MERWENKVDRIAEEMGIDPNEKDEPEPQHVTPQNAS